MILELCRDKYAKKRLSESKLNEATEFFIKNEDRWFKSVDLIMLLDYKSPRFLINKLRIAGMSIISDTKQGYKYTTNKEEIKICYGKLRERLLIGLTAARMLKRKF